MSEQMKLSTAIRAGAKLRPQARNAFFLAMAENGYCSCALGAAYEAVGGHFTDSNSGIRFVLRSTFPELKETNHADYGDLLDAIVEKNDVERMTREQIAAWLEEKGY